MSEGTSDRVIILGAGPVGLGAALELARFGVRSVLIEKHDSTSWHPKTRNFCTRTMEIARGWGRPVYERLRAIDTPDGWKTPIRFLVSATGEEYGRIDSKGFEGPGPAVSPALPIMSSQELIESILVDAARASGLVELRFGTRAVRLAEGGAADATRAVLEVERSGGERELVEGAAIVAADGAASLLRDELKLQLEGAKGLQHLVNCYFRADIESRIGERTGVLLFVANPGARGVLQPLDAKGRWLCQISVPAADWTPEAFTKERARDWVCAAVGDPTLKPDILSLGFWKLNATFVERLVQGRVVFVGDAAHQFPPTGGLGVNTGLQGMHNAMWKLAYCVRGEASWDLLETYNTERKPVAAQITAQSLQNSINVGRIQAARLSGAESGLTPEQVVTESRRYGNHLGVEFGAAYSSPAAIPDGSTPPKVADSYSEYQPSATPGCRAPHVWLGPPHARFSTLDLFGPHFVLLAGPSGQNWCEQAAAAMHTANTRVISYRIGCGVFADQNDFTTAYGIGEEGAVLVRPDGHVAWRSALPARSGTEIADALFQVLGRPKAGRTAKADGAPAVAGAMSAASPWTDPAVSTETGFARRDLVVPGNPPCSVWSRVGETPKAIVLIGHGGSQHRRSAMVEATARAILDRMPAYVVAIDGPVHGDRRTTDADITREAFISLWLTPEGGVPGMVADWKAALAATRALDGAASLPVGYYGVSMGTAYGVPLLAAEPSIRVAALGMWTDAVGGVKHLIAIAPQVRCAVQFVHREKDQFFDLTGARRLFDLIGAEEKTFDVLPGPHEETAVQIDGAAAYLTDYLTHTTRAAGGDRVLRTGS